MNAPTDPYAQHILEILQTAETAALAAIARGELDVRVLVLAELANRGMDHAGRWVGFPAAAKIARQAQAGLSRPAPTAEPARPI